nr:MAG: hypothetical protein [Microvirus Sku114]
MSSVLHGKKSITKRINATLYGKTNATATRAQIKIARGGIWIS